MYILEELLDESILLFVLFKCSREVVLTITNYIHSSNNYTIIRQIKLTSLSVYLRILYDLW